MTQPITDDLIIPYRLPVLKAPACRTRPAFPGELFKGFGDAMPDPFGKGADALLFFS